MGHVRLFKLKNFGFPSQYYIAPPAYRYTGISYDHIKQNNMNNAISSLKTDSWEEDHRMTTILFDDKRFKGKFVALWGSYPERNIPDLNLQNFNDKTSSMIMVYPDIIKEYYPIWIGDLARDEATEIIDQELETAIQSRGIAASRRGDLVFTWEMWPDWAPYKTFVQVDIPIEIGIALWPDYDATISYYISFYIDNQHRLRGYVDMTSVWVEGGWFTGSIIDQLCETANSMETTGKIEKGLNEILTELEFHEWDRWYLMPGTAPIGHFLVDYSGHTNDDVSLILIRK